MPRPLRHSVHIPVPMPDRPEMVGLLFASARRLGIARTEIRTTSEGFWVPLEIARDQFPSDYPEG